jgi:phosphomannomutase
VLACDLAATLAADGRTLDDRLDELARAHGVHRTEGISLRLERPPATPPWPGCATIHRPAGGPSGPRPTSWCCAGAPGPAATGWWCDQSGTEPKLKAYLQVVEPVVGDELAAARTRAGGRLDLLRDEVLALLGG